MRKGVVSEAVVVYSPGRSKKKTACTIISATTMTSMLAERSTAVSVCQMMAIGTGLEGLAVGAAAKLRL